MKKEIKDRWVKALRSGEYEQGFGQLKTGNGKFCCLGVLTDLYLKETGKSWSDRIGGAGASPDCRWRYHSRGKLPDEILVWSGIKESYGTYNIAKGVENSLTNLNDEKKMSFNEIANVIDKVWEKL